MTDWVSFAEAARIWRKNCAQVTRRVQQGRLTVRVFCGRRYLFLPEVVGYREPKMGNPDFIRHINGDRLDREAWVAMRQVIDQVIAKNADAVFRPKLFGAKANVEVMVLDEGKWARLSVRKLA